MSSAQAPPTPAARRRRFALPLLLVGALAAAVAGFALIYAPHVRREVVADVEQEFNLRADERQAAVAAWFLDRLDDVGTIAQFPTVADLAGPARRGGVGIGDSGHLGTVLTPFLGHQGLDALFVTDASGRVVGSARDLPIEPACATAALVPGEVAGPDVRVHAHHDGSAFVQFVAPVGGGGRVVGESRATSFLCPLVGQRAFAAGTAEWRLVHRVGDHVTWVCADARANTAPLSPGRPVDTPGLGAAAALDGGPRFGRFVDYRDTAVLAAPRQLVPGWGLVLKVDETEVLATASRRVVRTGAMVGALALAVLAVGWLAWRSRERSHELAITRARARAAWVLAQANDAIVFLSTDGRVVEANDRAVALFGGPRERLIGLHIHDDLRPHEERARAAAKFQEILERGTLVYESVLVTAQGTPLQVEISARVVDDDQGRAVVSVVRDIGARRAVERRQTRLNRLLRTLSEVNRSLVTSTSPDDLLARACRVIGETGGFDVAYIARAEPDGALPLVASWGPLANLLAGVQVRWDDSAFGRGPSGRAVRTRSTVVLGDMAEESALAAWRDLVERSGVRSGAACPIIVGDVTYGALSVFSREADAIDAEVVALLEKLAADTGLGLQAIEDRRQRAESEAQFRTVFDSAALGIVLATMDGRPLRANQAFLEMVGYREEELRAMRFDAFTHPDDAAGELPLYDEILAGTRDTYRLEKRYRRKDGGETWGALTLSTVRDAAGSPAYFIGLVEDVSERRRLQEQFQQAQKMESIGRLAGGVAHDFNNLLTAILGYAELLRAELGEQEPVAGFVDEIANAGLRSVGIIRQLLAFARRQVIEPRVLDLNAVVTDAERMLRRLVGEDVEIVTALWPGLWPVRADPGQLHQVLVNLAVNARDAMPRGGRLVVETANAELDEDYARGHVGVAAGAYVMLAVSDTGAGMSPEVQAHLFEPFFTTKPQGKGTGLGLATCHGIVSQSGGHIRVASEVGHGTTVRVYFPRVEAAPGDAVAAPTGGHALRGGTETIVIAEDEPSVRQLAAMSLRSYGYRVLEAADGDEALELARRLDGSVHLLVSDVVMPRMSGSELAIRFGAACPGVPVLFVSGHAEHAVAHNGEVVPGVQFLPKPFTPERLARKVREVLDAARGA